MTARCATYRNRYRCLGPDNHLGLPHVFNYFNPGPRFVVRRNPEGWYPWEVRDHYLPEFSAFATFAAAIAYTTRRARLDPEGVPA